MPRSSYYHQRVSDQAAATVTPPRVSRRRGPKPVVSDDDLLQHIKDDLATSPFRGEGHRKVWRRLRYGKRIVASRNRVLRVMRDHGLLSPARVPATPPVVHEGAIVTDAPNLMWGTDAIRVWTVEDGWCWCFSLVEHWNAECLGYHVCKIGSRFAALEPLSQAMLRIYGSAGPDTARGLALRIDHGPQYLSHHFQHQIAFWGIAPSFAFVEQPQTNGVVERFNRTLKEQAIYGRIFRNLEEVRQAVAAFVELYNREWLVEKLGYRSPLQMRADYGILIAA
jgi:transposase InsO family protein